MRVTPEFADPVVVMAPVRSFPPIARPDAHVLILGSIPGVASLAAGQYYAHPRNAFWPIMGALFGADPVVAYGKRVACLKRHGIAVWDVLKHCEREGSLDADIRTDSLQANDFAGFLRTHPRIARVVFNGATAQRLYQREVLPTLSGVARNLPGLRMPSTSPAYAAMDFATKLEAWRAALQAA